MNKKNEVKAMESRTKLAVELKNKGYNCAQAVACTYCDLVGLDEETMFKIMEGFGAGFGTTEGTCGAITGAVALAGMKNSSANLETPDSKASTAKLSREIMTRFKAKAGATICRVLKGVDTKVVLHSCNDCVHDAAKIVEEVVFPEKFN